MRVLLSIKPEFATKIFNGSKKYECRRVIFRRDGVKTAVVYVSEPVSKVVGEFEIGKILHENPRELWAKAGNQTGVTEKKFFEYFGDKNKGYAIEVKKARKYDSPIPLNELLVSKAPQSFMYLV